MMDYTITTLSVEELELALELIKKEQKAIERQEAVHLRNRSLLQESATALQEVRQQNEIDLYVNENTLSVIPDGPQKQKQLNRRAGLQYKKLTLADRTSTSGNVALLIKELNVLRIKSELAEINALIEILETRKALLLNPPAGTPPLQTGIMLFPKQIIKKK